MFSICYRLAWPENVAGYLQDHNGNAARFATLEAAERTARDMNAARHWGAARVYGACLYPAD